MVESPETAQQGKKAEGKLCGGDQAFAPWPVPMWDVSGLRWPHILLPFTSSPQYLLFLALSVPVPAS